jgi:hypothetical protein
VPDEATKLKGGFPPSPKMQPLKENNTSSKSGFGVLLCSCRDASRLQSEALDKELSFFQRLGLSLHLLICKWCRRYGKQIRFLRGVAHDHSENLSEAVPQKLSPEARERIKQRLRAGE